MFLIRYKKLGDIHIKICIENREQMNKKKEGDEQEEGRRWNKKKEGDETRRRKTATRKERVTQIKSGEEKSRGMKKEKHEKSCSGIFILS